MENQLEVGSYHGANLNGLVERSKPRRGDSDPVGIEGDIGEDKLACAIRGGGASQAAGGVVQVDRCAGNHCAGGIGDCAANLAGIAVLGRRIGCRKKQDGEGKNAENSAEFERHGITPDDG